MIPVKATGVQTRSYSIRARQGLPARLIGGISIWPGMEMGLAISYGQTLTIKITWFCGVTGSKRQVISTGNIMPTQLQMYLAATNVGLDALIVQCTWPMSLVSVYPYTRTIATYLTVFRQRQGGLSLRGERWRHVGMGSQ